MSEAVKQFTEETKKSRGDRNAKITTKEVISAGMFAAVLAVLSQISIPMPTGVPVTLQTFAVALTGVVLAWKLGTASGGRSGFCGIQRRRTGACQLHGRFYMGIYRDDAALRHRCANEA